VTVRVAVRKPLTDTVTEYDPGVTERVKVPSDPVVADLDRFVDSSVTVTAAPGRTTPLASRTMPEMVPAGWPHAGMPQVRVSSTTAAKTRCRSKRMWAS
jgi:hypothetical protein